MINETGWKDYDLTVKGQFDAATPTHSAWVSANAGSGKTKVLIDRVARLLLNGVQPDAIMCVTYTKAAASEMQGRLFKRLGGWCVADDNELAKQLAELQARNIKDYTLEELGKARELFALALETPGGLRIETIHAFCGRLLRRFPLEAHVAPGFKELDDLDASRLWDLAMAKLAEDAAHDDPDKEEELKQALKTAALAAGGNGLAGPLRALSFKQAAITKFIKDSGGLDAALSRLKLALNAEDQTVSQLIDYAMGPALPLDKLKPLIAPLYDGGKSDQSTAQALETVALAKTSEDKFAAYKRIFLTSTGEFRKSNPYTAKIAKTNPEIEELFQIKTIPEGEEVYRMKVLLEKINAREAYERSAALLRLSSIVFSDYARQKRRRAAMDFDDLIESAAGLLTTRSMAQWVLWKLEGGLSHILLDEAQDTSPEQWKLLNALTAQFFAGEGVEYENPRTLFVVGDEKQSIYSFQGADPEKFLSKRQEFIEDSYRAQLDNKTPDILMSFRSAPEVLAFVDEAFDVGALQGEAPFSIAPPEEDNVMRHLPFRKDQKGCVELWPLVRPKVNEESTPWDAPLGQDLESNPKAELADRIAKWIRNIIDTKQAISDEGEIRPARPGDVLILVRGRKGGLFDAIIKSLKTHDIPVAGADRIELLDSLPVQDLLNLIRFALCPQDDLTLAEILTGPFGGLNENDHLFPLAHDRGETSLWSRVLESDMEEIAPIRDFLQACIDRRHIQPYEFFIAVLETIGHDGLDGWQKIQSRLGAPAREPITALMDRAAGFDAKGPSSLQLFLATIEKSGGEVKRELSGPQDEVRVMTVHGSKGLEAPIVIVPDTCAATKSGVDNNLLMTEEDDGTDLPSGMPIWSGSAKQDTQIASKLRLLADAKAVREHRRLLYVALTRAQDRLLICGPWTGGAKSKTGHSESSWFATCHKAMQRLVDKDLARVIQDPNIENTDDADTPIAYEFGSPLFTDKAAHEVTIEKEYVPGWITQMVPRESQGNRYAAPSSLLGDEPAVLPPFMESRPKQLLRGRLIHTLLQTLPDIPKEDWRKHAMHFLTRDPELSQPECEEMYDRAIEVLDDPKFDPIFGENSKAEVPIVGGNDAKLPKGLLINGRVDRLVITDTSVLIVDFKTDRPAPAREEDMGPTYTAQMAAYRAVLESAYPDKQIRCAIVWTDGPKLMELDADRMDKALGDLT